MPRRCSRDGFRNACNGYLTIASRLEGRLGGSVEPWQAGVALFENNDYWAQLKPRSALKSPQVNPAWRAML